MPSVVCESFSTGFVRTILLLVSVTISGANAAEELLQLGKHKPTLGPIRILDYEPTPEDFYREYVRKSVPVLIRTNNPSWHKYLSEWNDLDFLRKHHGNEHGRAYKRTTWTQGWPQEVRMNFSEFLDSSKSSKLYWDSLLPLNSPLLQHVPLPLSINCRAFQNWITDAVLLYTNQNSSSVLHHDGAENFIFQISGKKTWLIANHSYSEHVYANYYDTQAGLSPVNPEAVDLRKYPLVAEIDFYQVTVEPGDMLYVPEYWWHQVRSYDPPIVALGIWSEIFNFDGLEDVHDVVAYTKKFAELRELEPSTITCDWQRLSLLDVNTRNWNSIFDAPEQIANASEDVRSFPIYFGSDEGAFYSVDSTGNLLWKYDVEEDAGSTPVLSADASAVIFAGEDATVYAFVAESGKLKWETRLGDGVAAALRLGQDGSTLYVPSLDGNFYALSTATGDIMWKQGPFGGELWATPIVHQNGIVVCVWTAETEEPEFPTVFLLNKHNGKVIWQYSTKSPVFSTPVIDHENGVLYVLSSDGNVHSIEIKTGQSNWMFTIDDNCEASPVFSQATNSLYLVALSGTITRVDLNQRKIVWQISLTVADNEGAMSSPLLSHKTNALYAAVGDVIYAINAISGDIKWEMKADGTFISSPRMDNNGILYIGCNDHNLYAINSKDGGVKWAYKTEGPVVSSVVLPNECVAEETSGALM